MTIEQIEIKMRELEGKREAIKAELRALERERNKLALQSSMGLDDPARRAMILDALGVGSAESVNGVG